MRIQNTDANDFKYKKQVFNNFRKRLLCLLQFFHIQLKKRRINEWYIVLVLLY